ncbi:hypothetical protein EVG20_g2946 [Dentipellis fragilis]|uniref:Calpain catalytic domain-containing protein n=1 Tax=Dentipellis fragilis TaxID=205917 RepID=A0A4Y9Z974_9AGAM|nr:hypothetical protein EVG20_g2946 [Dentipellis fragilis]
MKASGSKPSGTGTSTANKAAERDAAALYAKGAQAELGKRYDAAFRAYVDAAAAFLRLGLRAEAGKALGRAEKIKAARQGLGLAACYEQRLVLKRGGSVNGLRVPLWEEGEGVSDVSELGTTYTDPDGPLKLSPEQERLLTVWRRPRDVLGEITLQSENISPQDVVQRVIEDCSLCGSLAVCLGYNARHRAKAMLPSLYPCTADGEPEVSPVGRYDLKVWFNGAHRRITIDDQLPFDPNGNPMCLSTVRPSELWPSLVEKAYLKLMGGYDFPGSNSSIDIQPSFQREHTWLKIYQSFQAGQTVLTAGTGRRPSISWANIELLTAHSYAIIDLREDDGGERRLTILDSWKSRQTIDHALAQLTLDKEQPVEKVDMTWDEFCNVFDSIYVSWDPGMFAHTVHFHGMWRPSRLSDADKEDSSQQVFRLKHDQATTKIPPQSDVWILLTRHRNDTRKASDYISLHVEDTSDLMKSNAVHLVSDRPAGTYTNSPHVLVKTSLSEVSTSFLVSALCDGTDEDVGFTLTAYSSLPMHWESAVEKLPFDQKANLYLPLKHAGALTSPNRSAALSPPGLPETRGGPRSKARLLLTMRAAKELPLNVTVVWGHGKRVFDLVSNDVAATSGAYSYGRAHAEVELLPGDYTVVVSTFEASQQGPFSLRVESSHDVWLQPIPQEGAGMFVKTVRGQWTGSSAGGSAKFNSYTSNPFFELHVPSASEIMIRLQSLSKSAFINVSVFFAPTSPPPSSPPRHLDKLLVSSGPYADAVSGAVTPLTPAPAGRYVVVPSTYDIGVEAEFRIVVYSSKTSVDVTSVR